MQWRPFANEATGRESLISPVTGIPTRGDIHYASQLRVVRSHMFARDGALCYHDGAPDGRLRCTRGRHTRSGEPPDRCERVVRSSAVTAARTGEAAFWGRIRGFGPFGAKPRPRHATRRLIRGNSARRAGPTYATGVGGGALRARRTTETDRGRPDVRRRFARIVTPPDLFTRIGRS